MINIAVLVSGGGTNLQALIDAEQTGRLENGRIAACGSHEQLLAGCAAYREIVDSQMGEEEQHDGPQAC